MKARHGSYEYFDHAADVGIHAEADSIENLFFTCAEALLNWIGEPPQDPTEVCLDVTTESRDLEGLLVGWLQELLFLFQNRLLYTSRFLEMDLTDTKLKGIVMARVWDQSSHENFREVKAVTYHQLQVTHEGELWRAEIILDL
jgi:SHS2 domain-containing protein